MMKKIPHEEYIYENSLILNKKKVKESQLALLQ
jgi:hypothetical protein